MAGNLGKRPSKRGPISKIRPSDGCRRDAVLLAVERWYDFPEFGCHLGNVGSYLITTFFSLATAYPLVRYHGLYGVVFGTLTANLMMQAMLWRAFARPTQGAAE